MKNISKKDKIFDIFCYGFFIIIILLVLYPLYWIIIASFSDPVMINSGQVWLYPKGFSLDGYERIFSYSRIWIGYKNTIIYTLLGTTINVILTLSSGYVLSREDLVGRKFFTLLIIFTMFFSGGLIPSYVLIKNLNMIDTIWVMVIPNAVSAFNVILAKNFFENNIPKELFETSRIDNCSNIRFMISIVLPLSKAILAVIVVFCAVNHWNSYMQALIYLRDREKHPLQMILREILVSEQTTSEFQELTTLNNSEKDRYKLAQMLKYTSIIASAIPLLIIYPLLQKYFAKGVMIGAIKG